MADDVKIILFGRVSVVAGTHELDDFPTMQSRSLLAYLAMHPDENHPRDRLVEALWPGKANGSGRNRLSVAYYLLRRTLSGIGVDPDRLFVADRQSIRLDPTGTKIDLHDFRHAVLLSRATADPVVKRRHCARAVKIYRAPLLPDVRTEWSLAMQIETSEMFHEATIWSAKDAYDDDPGRALTILSNALTIEPYSERATELLTSWYVQNNEFESAMACARRLRNALTEQGRAPSRGMMDRIEELNLILADRVEIASFADEITFTVLSIDPGSNAKIKDVLHDRGARLSIDGRCGLFQNPIRALAAGRELLQTFPDARVLVHSTIMSSQEDVPSISKSGLRMIRRGRMYGTESSMWLLKTKGVKPSSEISRRIKLFRYA
ncbi:MAG: hypothetical protein IH945_00705 [Armatimonadetes bacterium]|nr:hypothetical protein [Armatimonadota bacterium]